MANEIQVRWTSGKTLYAQIKQATGNIWNTASSTFVAYATADVADYDVALSELGTASGQYNGTFPTGITTAGTYTVTVFERIGASVAETDSTVGIDTDFQWSGAAHVGTANYLPARITKNVAFSNFMFQMVLASDGTTAATGLTVTCQVSLDGGAFANTAGSVTEVANGWYRVNFTAAETNANVIAFRATASTALARNVSLVTQPG